MVHDRAEVKYSTVQNWYPGDANGKGGVYNFVTKRGNCKGVDSNGLRPHEAALARGCKVTGATVHFVNEECDGGPIQL